LLTELAVNDLGHIEDDVVAAVLGMVTEVTFPDFTRDLFRGTTVLRAIVV
jgi:hypothetical protein